MQQLLQKDVIRLMVDNVVPEYSNDKDHFSRRLQATPVLVDAADFGWVGRPGFG